jgi:protein-tyrosine kinase
MIIERAIERMKRQSQSATHPGYSASAAVRRDPQDPAPVELKFPRIDYDLRACERSHVLVPESAGDDVASGLTAYRMLRTRVLHLLRSNRWTTLALTSPGPGEGKSVTAINLALSLAREQNHNVFLIDLDMSSPSVCDYLGITQARGIEHFFAGAIEPQQAFFSIGIDRLAIAAGVEATPFSSELLASGRLDLLLRWVNSISPGALILLDLPPVLATDDFLVAAPRADATLLVLAEGKTRRDSVVRAMELLSGFTLAGVMLNRSHERVTDYYGRRYDYARRAAARPPPP